LGVPRKGRLSEHLARRFSEALAVADAGLAINPNYVPLRIVRAVAENSLGRFEQAKADAR
jgi:hypothetical protein